MVCVGRPRFSATLMIVSTVFALDATAKGLVAEGNNGVGEEGDLEVAQSNCALST